MSQIKVCPHCGSKMFVGAITRGCAIESVIDENGLVCNYDIELN